MPLCQLSNLQNANITGKKQSIVLHLDNTTRQHAKINHHCSRQRSKLLANRKKGTRSKEHFTNYQLVTELFTV